MSESAFDEAKDKLKQAIARLVDEHQQAEAPEPTGPDERPSGADTPR